jgi:hypothetical protein
MTTPTAPLTLPDDAPSAWRDQSLVLELEALLDARRALMTELMALDEQVASHFSRLLPDAGAFSDSTAQKAPGAAAFGA